MRVLKVRNVHEGLHAGLRLLNDEGETSESRNGSVMRLPEPVATVYTNPCERVLFWSARDANPFFHLYEALWMLAGREDVKPLLRYAKQIKEYSDDGQTMHGAYGYRWRTCFVVDQLEVIVNRLKEDPSDRRCVLQMWSTINDLDIVSKDLPCNVTATFQIFDGKLNLVVFCRSNDIIWGCYGANAVHFSTLLEYMALHIGCEVGTYKQVSVNWHAYNEVLETTGVGKILEYLMDNPYDGEGAVRVSPMASAVHPNGASLDEVIRGLLFCADENHFMLVPSCEWQAVVWTVFRAHAVYSNLRAPEKFQEALAVLRETPEIQDVDWIVAAREWIERRQNKWLAGK